MTCTKKYLACLSIFMMLAQDVCAGTIKIINGTKGALIGSIEVGDNYRQLNLTPNADALINSENALSYDLYVGDIDQESISITPGNDYTILVIIEQGTYKAFRLSGLKNQKDFSG